MLETKIINGGISFDDRGSVSFVNEFDFSQVNRFYCISNIRKNYIRAWHGHEKEGKFFFVTSGHFRIGAVNLETKEIHVKYLNGLKPQVLFIPPGYANGLQNLTEDNNLMVFSTATLEESVGDDIRFPWDEWDIWELENYR